MYLPPLVKEEDRSSSQGSKTLPPTRSPSPLTNIDTKIPQGHFGNLLCESYPGMIHIKEDRNSPSGRLKWIINFTFATGSEMWEQVNQDLVNAEEKLHKALTHLKKEVRKTKQPIKKKNKKKSKKAVKKNKSKKMRK